MKSFVSESRFNMWRAVIAMIHADKVVRPHEVHFIMERTKDLDLSEERRAILAEDILTPRAIGPLFRAIDNPKDREDFFHLAHSVCWEDGELDAREVAMLKHVANLNPGRVEARRRFEVYIHGHGDIRLAHRPAGGLLRRLIGRAGA